MKTSEQVQAPQWPWQFAALPHTRIITVPAFQDNYLWLMCDSEGKKALVIDPGDAKPVTAALQAHGLSLAGILLTHHHPDHIGGVAELVSQWQCPVYGAAQDSTRLKHLDHALTDGQQFSVAGFDYAFTVLDVPGHTVGHIAYYSEPVGQDDRGLLFCGDTLFAGGCGRMFEGQPAQMLSSLKQLSQLPPDTLVYCAHEYTLANLAFACAAEPNSQTVVQRLAEAQQMRQKNLQTVPTSISIEQQTNPFLRCSQPGVIAGLAKQGHGNLPDEIAHFAALRAWKDNF